MPIVSVIFLINCRAKCFCAATTAPYTTVLCSLLVWSTIWDSRSAAWHQQQHLAAAASCRLPSRHYLQDTCSAAAKPSQHLSRPALLQLQLQRCPLLMPLQAATVPALPQR